MGAAASHISSAARGAAGQTQGVAVTSAQASLRASSDDPDVSPSLVTRTLGVIPSETILLGHRRGRFRQADHVWLIDSGEVVAPDQQAVELAVASG